MSHERVVELHRQPGIGFGFSVIGGCDTHIPHMICALVRDSPALVSGQVFVGDVLHKVNGINLYELQTKQVVDLIRGCKDKITLTLKEDRLAKLKARPFLADDTLIEPLYAAKDTVSIENNYSKQTQFSSSHGRNNSLDNSVKLQSPNISFSRSFDVLNNSINNIVPNNQILSTRNHGARPYSLFPGDRVLGDSSRNGVDGRFTRLQSHEESPFVNNKRESPSSPKRSFLLAQSFGIPSPIMNRSKSTFNYVSSTNNILEGDVLLRRNLPEDLGKHENNLQAISQNNTFVKKNNGFIKNDYKAEKISYQYDLDDLPSSPRVIKPKNPSDNITSPLLTRNEINNLHINESLNKSVSPHNLKKQPLVYVMSPALTSDSGNCTSQIDSGINEVCRPVQRRFSNIRPCSSSDVDQIPQSLKVESFQSNNFSSPNVFESDNERIGSEQKKLTLTPYTHSALSLQDINKQYIFNPQQSSLNRNCPTFEPSTDLVSSNRADESSKTIENISNLEISPADIASRLFTLNGYKDTDIAPMLGKNTKLSQEICKEYLQFYRFDGLSLDGALRMFLGNFPLTGETQERERILIQFTKRYMECNSHCDMSEDAVHTLVCSLMLLNTDLHGHGVTNRMSLNDFVNNLSGLCDGKDFQRDQLKTLYNSIKSKKMVFASSVPASPSVQGSPKQKRLNSSSGNPYIELKLDSNDKVIYEGLLNRKSVMDPGGRRTPAMKRNWRQFYCLLKGIILIFYKHDIMNDVHSVGIHHALAGYAKDYKKRAYVFKIIAADWSVYYIQAKNQDDVRQWMDCINVAAAMLSSPPLPAPVSSSMRFQRPVMPVSKAKLTKEQQLQHHNDQIKSLEGELKLHTTDKPDIHDKHYLDWENKLDYLEFEVKRFKAYCSVLTSSRLENIRQTLLASLSNDVANDDNHFNNKNVE